MDLTSPFLICLLTISLGETAEWSYEEQDKWPGSCNSGEEQSPINLPTNSKLISLQQYKEIKYQNYEVPLQGMISNSGHSVVVNLKNSTSQASISGGGLPDEYCLQQFHFHWGGAEHLVGYRRYPVEAHFVHYAKKYGTFEDALKHDDGIAVLGIFYDKAQKKNPAFKSIAKKIPDIAEYGSESLPLQVVLKDFFPEKIDSYYRYKGSLTTPGCNEVVTWTVFYQPSYISQPQLSPFFKVQSSEGHPVKSNYRKIQKLNGRTIYFNKK